MSRKNEESSNPQSLIRISKKRIESAPIDAFVKIRDFLQICMDAEDPALKASAQRFFKALKTFAGSIDKHRTSDPSLYFAGLMMQFDHILRTAGHKPIPTNPESVENRRPKTSSSRSS
jgi:hypothetical protein